MGRSDDLESTVVTAYLDHAATTPMWPAAVEAYAEQSARTGNASSLHTAGRRARAVVEEARERIAAALGARPSEVVFTSGGTEADNLAVKGAHAARVSEDPARRLLVVSGIEHHAVLDPVLHLVDSGAAQVAWLEPDRSGVIAPDALREVLRERANEVSLVSIIWANNEVGTVQSVADFAALAHEHGIPLHTDAVQAVSHLPVSFADSEADLLTLTGHKTGGPLGVGALLAKRNAQLVPQLHGGGQERQVRSGTLDVPAIHAFALALERTVAVRAAETTRVGALRDALIARVLDLDLGISVSGAYTPGDVATRVAGNVHLLVPGCQGDSLLYLLDAAGIECSTGSACQAGVPRPSHVLLAMGYSSAQARGALRLSLGHTSTAADVDRFVAVLPGVVERARRANGVS